MQVHEFCPRCQSIEPIAVFTADHYATIRCSVCARVHRTEQSVDPVESRVDCEEPGVEMAQMSGQMPALTTPKAKPKPRGGKKRS